MQPIRRGDLLHQMRLHRIKKFVVGPHALVNGAVYKHWLQQIWKNSKLMRENDKNVWKTVGTRLYLVRD
jgi:hypothetical protein